MKLTIYLAIIIGLFACKGNKTASDEGSANAKQSSDKAAISDPCSEEVITGVTGNILWLEGDFMPGPGTEPKKGEPTQREVLVFKPFKRNDVKNQEGVFFFPDPNKAIATQLSSEKGCYKIALEPGFYSIVVNEGDKGYFANSFNGQDVVQSITVKEGELTQLDIDINYKAAY